MYCFFGRVTKSERHRGKPRNVCAATPKEPFRAPLFILFFLKKGQEPLGKRFSILLRCNRVPQSLILFASGTHRVGCSWAAINYDTLILNKDDKYSSRLFAQQTKLPPLASVSLHTDCRSDSISLGPYAPIMHLGNWILNEWAAYR